MNALIDWTAYNIVIANADAHGKNLALLHQQDRTIALAPFYDLIPTGTFPGNLVDRNLAMAVGNARSVDEVRPQDWDAFARSCGLTPRYVIGRLAAVVDRVQAALQATADQLQ